MAKYGLLHNKKFKRLETLLGIPRPHILGHLELLWMSQQLAETDVIGDAQDLELLCEWTGSNGHLSKALEHAQFVHLSNGVYTVSNFWEHAPTHLVDRLSKRHAMTKADIRAGKHAPNSSPEIPFPPKTSLQRSEAKRSEDKSIKRSHTSSARACSTTFDDFWAAYPRKVGKVRCEKWWAKRKPDAALVTTIMAGLEAHKRCRQWTTDGGTYIPHPLTWLNREGWNDEPETTPEGVHVDAKEEIPF